MPGSPLPSPRATQWLVRLGEVFAPWAPALWERLGCAALPLAPEFWLLRFDAETELTSHREASLFRWCLPVDHAWPVNPRKTEGFVEKGTRALAVKLGTDADGAIPPRNAFVTSPPLDVPLKTLASNFRGRLLQVFPFSSAQSARPGPEQESPTAPVIHAFLCAKGLFAGVTSASHAKSPYPGGTKFVHQGASDVVSRAGAKVVEALTLLPLRGFTLPATAHWLELGASPGGMTAELLKRGFRVTAIDRAPLSPALAGKQGLAFHQIDVAAFSPVETCFDALVCDMNGSSARSLHEVVRLSRLLPEGAPVIFTLKFIDEASLSLDDALASIEETDRASRPSLSLQLVTHSTYNRRELTCLFRKL